MPRITLSNDNKSKSASDYPKLFLDSNERARALALESQGPEVGFAHTLRMPVVVGGQVVMEKQTRGNETVEVPKMEFVGRHICIGSFDVLSEKGSDPKGCPVCKENKESGIVDPPQRRFAMHIVRYKIKPGSFTVQEPFMAELQVWAFTDMVFTKLVDFAEEWGDLRKHDLLLGPCTNKNFQKFDISIANSAEWLGNEERTALVKEVYANNQCSDLSAFIGRKLTREQIVEDLDKVLRRHQQAYGGDGPVQEDEAASISASDAASGMDLESLLSDDTEPTTEAAPSAVVQELASKPKGEVADLDDILSGL